ncbi:MAG: DUF3179 domain-containing protein [Thermoleophilaceae bacterium]|nr:DUF3179 domain-containing protein [Thermoleophilaceae bacterium]
MRLLAAATVVLIALSGCGSDDAAEDRGDTYDFGAAPQAPAGEGLGSEDARAAVRSAVVGSLDTRALDRLAESGDARQAWIVSDLLRFTQAGAEEQTLVRAFERLTGRSPRKDPQFAESPWLSITNHLIAWDLPAPPGYVAAKAELFTALEPGWRPFFADKDAEIDWRLVSWGGVGIDDRRAGDSDPCPQGCIPALDDPELTSAREGDWYPDGEIVFGVVVGSEALALPRNIMEVHEMVNLTLGGRRLGIPYCTLCGSAQAYFTDTGPRGRPPALLRTSGLLSRSNKVMYDLRTRSVMDTFTGRALSGPLHDAGVELDQATVVASTWGAWKRAHPTTRIIARDGGIGRTYPRDPLGDRDDDGPIFPTGPVDPRLPVQTRVIGVIAPGGEPVAFDAAAARRSLSRSTAVRAGGVELVADGSGFRARAASGGRSLVAHEAFWFAWSQFHPRSAVWIP